MKAMHICSCLLLFSFIILACHRDKKAEQSFLSVDKTSLTELAAAGSDKITISSNTNWRLGTLPSWLSADKTSGSGNEQVIFSYTANSSLETRSADVNINSSVNSLTPITIKINQGGVAPYILLDKSSAREDSTGQTDSVVISSNTAWTLSLPATATWFTPDRTSGNAGVNKVHFTVTANNTNQPRTAEITIASTSSAVPPQKLTFSQNPNFHIESFSPASGTPGTQITLTGIFGTHPIVKVNGVTATNISLNTDGTRLTFTVPDGTASGKITVLCDGGISLTSVTDFTMIRYGITSFSPAELPAGSTTPIVISGTFDPNATPIVTVNGVTATVTSHDATTITITLPSTATTGKISVSFGGATYTSANDFIITRSWVQIPGSQSTFSYTGSVSFVYNNKIYFGLGNNFGSGYNKGFKIYDPQANTWSQGPLIASTMNGRAGAVCVMINNKVYIGLGNEGFNQSDWWEFDPSKTGDAAWRQLTSHPLAADGGIAFNLNGILYAGIPYQDGSIYQFDPVANSGKGSWQKMLPGSFPKVKNSSFYTINNTAYIVGGTNTSQNNVPYNTRFEPSINTAGSILDLPLNAANAPAFSLNGKGYIVTNGATYEYDPAGNTWKKLDGTSPNVSGVYNAAVINEVVYVWEANGTMYKF
jgi:hypothetical protein